MRDINFFSEYQGKEKEQNNTLVYVLIGAIILFVAYTYVMNAFKINSIENEITALETKLTSPELVEQVKLSEEVNKKLEILYTVDQGLTEVINAVDGRDIVSVDILNKLSSTLPSDVSFKSLTITNGSITIQAVSKSRTAIGEVQHNLKALDIIDDVYIGGISGMGGLEDEFTFDLRCVLKGGQ
ncbi:MAG: PilN domain-containing protein [Turicibacter sp.]